MISKWVDESNIYKLTRAEAVAFIYFMLSEEKRHMVDIRDIQETVRHVREQFGIEHQISEVEK